MAHVTDALPSALQIATKFAESLPPYKDKISIKKYLLDSAFMGLIGNVA